MSKNEPVRLPLRIEIAGLIFAQQIGPGGYRDLKEMAAGSLAQADIFVEALKDEAARKLSLAETERIVKK